MNNLEDQVRMHYVVTLQGHPDFVFSVPYLTLSNVREMELANSSKF